MDDNHNAPGPARKRAKSGTKEYVPQVGSGAYALIITLFKNLEQPTSRGYMMKAELMDEAQPLADKSFSLPDPGCRYTAWSSMGTLIKKGYVTKEKSPARYTITATGCELAYRLLQVDNPNQGCANVVCGQPLGNCGSGQAESNQGLGQSLGNQGLGLALGNQGLGQAAGNQDSWGYGQRLGGAPSHEDRQLQASAEPAIARTYNHAISDSSDEEDDIYRNRSDIPRNKSPEGLYETSGCRYCYVDENGLEVKNKDNAHVLIDEEISIGFLVRVRYEDLLLSGKRYKIDSSRLAEGDFVYAYLHNDDADDLCPGFPQTTKVSDVNTIRNITEDSPKLSSLKDRLPQMKCLQRETSKPKHTSAVSSSAATSSSCAQQTTSVTKQKDSVYVSDSHQTALLRQATSVVNTVPSNTTQTVSRQNSSNIRSVTSEPKSLPTPKYTLKPGTFELVLCVDNREFFGGSGKNLLPELKKNSVNCELRKLEVGDFLWVARDRGMSLIDKTADPEKEVVLDYVIERKRMDDLAGSITDGRFREQKFRMKNCGVRKPGYLVEDYGSSQHFSIPESSLMQAIINTQVIDGFFVKRTRDTRESAAYLTVMTRYLQSYYKDKSLLACCKDDLHSLEDFDLNDSEMALMTFKEFNDTTVKTKAMSVKEMFGKQLVQLHGLTAEKAAGLVQVFPTPAILMEAYDSCTSVKQKEEILTQVKYGPLKRNLGKQLSKQLSQLYCTDGSLL